MGLWIGNAPDALSSGKIPADLKLWLTAAPAALTTNGYVQGMLLRWLTDNAGGTPDALSSGKMPADLKLWLAVAPLALSSQQVQAIVSAYAIGQAPLQPTVAGRTLDVSAGGEAGVDWANVGSQTTTVGLSGTTIKAVTDGVAVANITGDVQGERHYGRWCASRFGNGKCGRLHRLTRNTSQGRCKRRSSGRAKRGYVPGTTSRRTSGNALYCWEITIPLQSMEKPFHPRCNNLQIICR